MAGNESYGITVIASGVAFGEGPVWCADTGTVVCTAVASGELHRIWPDEPRSEVIANIGGGPNACAPTSDGGFLVTQNGGIDFSVHGLPGFDALPPMRPRSPGILRVAADGTSEYLATHDSQGRALSAPNDLVTMPDGSVFFTDPPHHPLPPDPAGRVLRLGTDGVAEETSGPFHYCNGIARDPQGRLLIIEANGVMVLAPDGTTEWLVEDLGGVQGDGMAVDVEGRIHVCCPMDNRIRVLSPSGELESVIELGDGSLPTNCCFGGADGTDLFVTLAMAQTVVRVEGLPYAGVPVLPWPGLSPSASSA